MNGKRGFTLIELLVVIAIIALLMSIMMPALARVKKQSQSVACRARLKQWGLLFKLYTDDYDGYFNEGWGYGDHHPGGSGEMGLYLNALRPYYKDNWEMLKCPTATRVVQNENDWGTFKSWFRDVDLPGGGEYRYIGSYGINSWTNYMIKDRGARPVANFWKTAVNVKNPDTVPVLGDATWHDAWPWETDQPVAHPFDFGWESPGTTDEMNHFNIDRHSGFVNFAMMDWSVRYVGLKELWTLRWHRNWERGPAGEYRPSPWTTAGGVMSVDWPQWMRRYKDY
ncbi:MAG: type II secretion system protein [Phycisphaerales bacterium]|nr:MAG: type II secretion system protein [Phycisphaerales bacterium]